MINEKVEVFLCFEPHTPCVTQHIIFLPTKLNSLWKNYFIICPGLCLELSDATEVCFITQLHLSLKCFAPYRFIHSLKAGLVRGAVINKVNSKETKLLMGE